jgi:hypothetical protein
MAIWDSTSLNTDALASAVNKWDDLNFVPAIVKRNALLYAMMGFSAPAGQQIPNWSSVFKKDFQVQGNNLVVRLLGELETISTLADANQLDAVSWNNNTNAIGGAVFAWTHYSHNEGVRDSEYELIVGNEARTASYMDDVMERLRLSRHDVIGTAINSTNDQARTTLGGWEFAVDSTGTYGTLDKAQNTFFAGNETDVGGAGDLDDIDAMRTDIWQDGGNPTLGLAPKVPYNKLKQELRGYAQAIPTSWDMYKGGGLLHYDGTTFAFEHRCTSTVVGMLTPEHFRFYRKNDGAEINVISKEIMQALLKGAKLGFTIREWNAFICRHPGAQGKLTGWTS